MGSVVTVLIYTLVVMLAVILVALILVQPSKSGGFGSAFGGLGESVFGAQAMGHLSKMTVYCISLFFFLTLLLAVISGHTAQKNDTSAVLAQSTEKTAVSTEAVQPGKTALPVSSGKEQKK